MLLFSSFWFRFGLRFRLWSRSRFVMLAATALLSLSWSGYLFVAKVLGWHLQDRSTGEVYLTIMLDTTLMLDESPTFLIILKRRQFLRDSLELGFNALTGKLFVCGSLHKLERVVQWLVIIHLLIRHDAKVEPFGIELVNSLHVVYLKKDLFIVCYFLIVCHFVFCLFLFYITSYS